MVCAEAVNGLDIVDILCDRIVDAVFCRPVIPAFEIFVDVCGVWICSRKKKWLHDRVFLIVIELLFLFLVGSAYIACFCFSEVVEKEHVQNSVFVIACRAVCFGEIEDAHEPAVIHVLNNVFGFRDLSPYPACSYDFICLWKLVERCRGTVSYAACRTLRKKSFVFGFHPHKVFCRFSEFTQRLVFNNPIKITQALVHIGSYIQDVFHACALNSCLYKIA